jgi:hypothetical protein
MSHLPFVLRGAQPFIGLCETVNKDVPSSEDPLPPALEIGPSGFVQDRETRVTEVRYETTDDN